MSGGLFVLVYLSAPYNCWGRISFFCGSNLSRNPCFVWAKTPHFMDVLPTKIS